MKTIGNRNSVLYKGVKAVIQKLVNAETHEWPPLTACGMYQPHRPEMSKPKE